MVNAGSRLKKLAHRRGFLDLGQAGRIIVDTEFAERAVEVDQMIRHRNADQGAEEALAD